MQISDEKLGRERLSVQKLKDFNDRITQCGLSDIKSIGTNWSWHYNSLWQARIYGKLDRALCNDT